MVKKDGSKFVNGVPHGSKDGQADLRPVGHVSKLPGDRTETGPLGPFEYLATLQQSEVVLWAKKETVVDGEERRRPGRRNPGSRASKILRPGNSPLFKGLTKDQLVGRLEFVSLMMALFCGNRLIAAHIFDSLLHGQESGGGSTEHRRGHRNYRRLLRTDTVSWPGGHDQWNSGSDRFEYGRAIAGEKFWRNAVRHHFGDRFHHGAVNGQRVDRRREWRGGSRSDVQRVAIANE